MSNTSNNTYTDTEKRLYFLSDDIDNASIGKLSWNILHQIEKDDKNDEKEKDYKRDPIKLYINSCGGDVRDAWGLIDIILNSKTPVYTYCTGYAMSAALKIFLAGHKRYCYKHSTFMYHQMYCRREGTYQNLVEDRTEMDELNRMSEEYVLERTKFTRQDIDDIRNKKMDLYFHADEAIKYGVVNEVI
jgi:ATP-dependent Clp protease protease subunit|nr:MAG TPA: hypothetical protein [Bacteriophage sp.]